MQTISLCDDIRVSDASGPDGPVLRSVRITLRHAALTEDAPGLAT